MAKFTEEDILMRRIGQRFNKGVVKYRLIDDDDKILVGLSGGKDSLALLELLAKRSRILKPKFSVVAVHVSMSNIPYQADLDYLRSYAEGLGVKFIHYEPVSTRRQTPASHLVSSVRGIVGRPCLPWPKKRDATRLLSVIIWTISLKPCS